MIRINDSYSDKIAIRHIKKISLLLLCLFSNLILELFFNLFINLHSNLTLWENIQSSLTPISLVSIIFLLLTYFILFSGILTMLSTYGLVIVYITLLKFFELIPSLIDIFNLLFIYHDQINYSSRKTLLFRLNCCLIMALIRLIINTNVVRQKCDCKWKGKIMTLFNLIIFTLVNITVLRYSTKYLFRIGRKIILAVLMYQLDDLFYHEDFWIDIMKWHQHIPQRNLVIKFMNFLFNQIKCQQEYVCLKIIRSIILIRLIISSLIVCLFSSYILKSMIITKTFFIHSSFRSYGFVLMICIGIFYLLYVDALHNGKALNEHGIFRFCIGTDLTSITRTTDMSFDLQRKTNTSIIENIR